MTNPITYEQSGVSIDANDIMVEKIQESMKSTFGPRVINLPNGFAGLFSLDYNEKLFKRNYRNPLLVACTDGVGTKILVAQMMKKFDTIGQDLVAMSVNDMLVLGAEPLFFLDYLAVNKLEPDYVAQLVASVAAGCRIADCALIGGETAEMPDIYGKNEYDMAGFAVGVVEKHRVINGTKVQVGDVILGLASSGLHSNGYSLARRIAFKKLGLKAGDKIYELNGKTVGEAMLEPTRIYVRSVLNVLGGYKVKQIVHGMAHITGGGLVGNIPRVLPADCNAVIDSSAWPVPAIFKWLAKNGPVEDSEMFRVFNMGIGFVMIVAPDFADSITERLTKTGEKVYRLGKIARGGKKVIIKWL